MKAQTALEKLFQFKEYYENIDKTSSTEIEVECKKVNAIQALFAYTNFLGQPFKHEMIPEYFEGWVHINAEEAYKAPIYANENYRIHTQDDDDRLTYISSPNVLGAPETCDEFISDCNRAGISLELKEGVI